jgi:large subunit ribosomal protein L9
LRATKDNRAKFETMKTQLEARNLERKGDAGKVGAKLDGQTFTVIRQASETGQLYGSVSPRDIVAILTDGGFTVLRSQIALNTPIKNIGLHKVPVALHPEVEVSIAINVARSADEAERIARGENVIAPRDERLVMETGEAAASEDFFENAENTEERGTAPDTRADTRAK